VELSLSHDHFQAISKLVYRVAGIKLQAGKENLVRTRLSRRVRTLGYADFSEYLNVVSADASGAETAAMVDLLTTNKTSFFRESQHFDYLREQLFPLFAANGRVTIWSAGCSTGEEAYTLAMLTQEHLPSVDPRRIRILATDISARVLETARAGEYSDATVREVVPLLRQKYFVQGGTRERRTYRVRDELRSLIRFARLNLMEPWPMKREFDAIFCRNVMIYFDRPTQETLVNRFYELLPAGGHLFVGHSESLTALDHRFTYVRPALYRK
jgi:chemotaxis protein methyltransferase CheR